MKIINTNLKKYFLVLSFFVLGLILISGVNGFYNCYNHFDWLSEQHSTPYTPSHCGENINCYEGHEEECADPLNPGGGDGSFCFGVGWDSNAVCENENIPLMDYNVCQATTLTAQSGYYGTADFSYYSMHLWENSPVKTSNCNTCLGGQGSAGKVEYDLSIDPNTTKVTFFTCSCPVPPIDPFKGCYICKDSICYQCLDSPGGVISGTSIPIPTAYGGWSYLSAPGPGSSDIQEMFKYFGPCKPPGPCARDCQGDVNGDGKVDMDDLMILIQNWLSSCSADEISKCCNGADINGDGKVDMGDFNDLVSNMGKQCG